ncbi:hypothetical protein ACFL4L_06385 [bacterium]
MTFQIDMSGVENDISPVENDTSGVENDISSVENDISGVENDISPIEDHSSGVENDISLGDIIFYPCHAILTQQWINIYYNYLI